MDIQVKGPDGHLRTPVCDADGKLVVTGIAGGGGGAGDASAANQTTQIAQIGEVQTSPTANTVLDRLKTLASLIGEVQASPTSNTLLDRVKGLATLLAGGLPAALTPGGGVKMGLVDEIPAGTKSIGAVSSNSVVSSATITRPENTTAYAAKDVISTTLGAVIEFTGMARANGGFGSLVKSRVMTNQSTCIASLSLHLFNAAPTAIADNAQYTMLWANRDKRIGTIRFPALSTGGTGSDAAAAMRPSYDGAYSIPDFRYQCAANDTKLYGILVTEDVFTPASGQIFFIEHTADWLS